MIERKKRKKEKKKIGKEIKRSENGIHERMKKTSDAWSQYRYIVATLLVGN